MHLNLKPCLSQGLNYYGQNCEHQLLNHIHLISLVFFYQIKNNDFFTLHFLSI